MTEIPAKNDLRALVSDAISMAIAKGHPLTKFRGTAFFDLDRDSSLRSLSPFAPATLSVTKLPSFEARFGADQATRVALQFVYEYFSRVDSLQYVEDTFQALWLDFEAEVQSPEWVFRAVANVRNFKGEDKLIDLGNRITIRGRSAADLAFLGFGNGVWQRLSEDWTGFGVSSFVLVAEETLPKQPKNVILLDAGSVWKKGMRAVGALRLAAAGDLSIGPMWVVRAARFNFGVTGIGVVGISIPATGSEYVWTQEVAHVYSSVYSELAELERVGYDKSPGNLDLALRSFMATYDRWPPGPDSQLLDAITALEALLGSGTEVAFKLAFRVAALLAANDSERGVMLELMKEFYDTRSKLVHGARLKKKHEDRLANVNELRSLVRSLLRVFVRFATNPPPDFGRPFFERNLDSALVDATEREKVRAALGLSRNQDAASPRVSRENYSY